VKKEILIAMIIIFILICGMLIFKNIITTDKKLIKNNVPLNIEIKISGSPKYLSIVMVYNYQVIEHELSEVIGMKIYKYISEKDKEFVEINNKMEKLNEYINKYPDDVNAYCLRSLEYFNLEKYYKSLWDINRVIKDNKDINDLYLYRGIIYFKAKIYSFARNDFQRVLKNDSTNNFAINLLKESKQAGFKWWLYLIIGGIIYTIINIKNNNYFRR